MNERRLDALTSTRFFACLLVVLYHYAPDLVKGWPGVESVVLSGYLGVTFFFVLSGFVLTAVYGPRAERGGVDPKKFYIARFARVYPIYIASILLAAYPYYKMNVAVDFPGAPPIPTMIEIVGLRATMLSAWVPDLALRLNGPAWSLSVEAFFYALFPFIVVPMLRSRDLPRRALVLAVLLMNVAPTYLLSLQGETPAFSWIRYFPLAHLGTFLVGCEAGLVFLRREEPKKQDGPPTLLCGALIAAGFLLHWTVPYGLLHDGLLAVPFGVAILWLARNDARLGWLGWAPLVLLGEASYSIYILQSPVASVYKRTAQSMGLPGPSDSFLSFAIYLGLLVAAAISSFRLFESPARAWLRARLEPKGSREAREPAQGIEGGGG